MKFLPLILVLLLMACSQETETPVVSQPQVKEVEQVVEKPNFMTDSVVKLYKEIGLERLTDDRILIDLRYATDNNFMGVVLYDTLNALYLQKDVIERLSKCQDYLDTIYPGYKLKIFDGVRPLMVQREMWDALDTVPMWKRGKFVSNPIYGSVHNYGTAVDLTICDSNGIELDMGAGYDDFRDIAFPSKEAHFLKTGELTKEQYENRKLLRAVMRSQRFYNIPSEWWHFNAYSRLRAEAKYEILLSESGNHQKWVSPPLPKDSLAEETPIDSTMVEIP